MGPRRGDVFFLDFPDLGGHVISGVHPAVVIQADRMARSSTSIVAPMTSSPREAPFAPAFLVAVSSRESGMSKDGFVKCDQLLTFPTPVLGRKAGRLNPEAMGRVDAALRFVLGI